MTTREWLTEATRQLTQAGCHTPRLDADTLLMHAWKISRTTLITRLSDEVPAPVSEHFQAMLARRKQREPVAYITGEKEFWSRPFSVDPHVLIPRPETEHLIEAVFEHFPDHHASLRFCDIGTGSGCIPVTLACEYPEAHIVATDISTEALTIARSNAIRHNVADRIDFLQGDMLKALEKEAPFHAILSNPPYVSKNEYDKLETELGFEPRNALTDEADGLIFLRMLVKGAPGSLLPKGLLIVETGLCGLPDANTEMELSGEIRDLAGMLRGGVYRRS